MGNKLPSYFIKQVDEQVDKTFVVMEYWSFTREFGPASEEACQAWIDKNRGN